MCPDYLPVPVYYNTPYRWLPFYDCWFDCLRLLRSLQPALLPLPTFHYGPGCCRFGLLVYIWFLHFGCGWHLPTVTPRPHHYGGRCLRVPGSPHLRFPAADGYTRVLIPCPHLYGDALPFKPRSPFAGCICISLLLTYIARYGYIVTVITYRIAPLRYYPLPYAVTPRWLIYVARRRLPTVTLPLLGLRYGFDLRSRSTTPRDVGYVVTVTLLGGRRPLPTPHAHTFVTSR